MECVWFFFSESDLACSTSCNGPSIVRCVLCEAQLSRIVEEIIWALLLLELKTYQPHGYLGHVLKIVVCEYDLFELVFSLLHYTWCYEGFIDRGILIDIDLSICF